MKGWYTQKSKRTHRGITRINRSWDHLEGWAGWEAGGRFKRERTRVYLWLADVDVWQKPVQYYKPDIFQLKIN